MEDTTCKCGCGETLPATNKTGWKWGHKGKSTTAPILQPDSEAAPTLDPEPEEDAVEVSCPLNEFQLNRIWDMLPIREKALAITQGLLAVRE